jgi:hypothetical protein
MMDKKEFEEMDKKFKGAIKRIRDWTDSDDVEFHTAITGGKLNLATKISKGHVCMEYDAPRCMLDISGHEGVLYIAVQQLVEHFGVEKILEIVAACCFMEPKTVNVLNKTFETNEEKEVFKRLMNMSEEEREKIKNEL